MDAVSQVSDHDSIVAEPPPLMRKAMPLIFAAGLAYGWYLWNQASNGARVPWNAWYLPGLALLCGVLWLFNGSRRVVMDRSFVSEYWGGRRTRRYHIRAITAIRSELNAVKLVFADRGTITIPTVWPGANDIVHHMRSVIDVRTSAAPPVDDWLPLNYLTFPPRCVSCGASRVIVHPIFAGKHYHVPGASLTSGCEIPIPACTRCSRRRKVLGFLTALGLIASIVGVIGATVISSDRFPGVGSRMRDSLGVFLLAFLALFFGISHVISNVVPRWLDRRLLGVAAVRLGKDKTTVRLSFRDRQEEMDVRTLTAQRRTEEMSSAAESLRAPDF